MSAVEQSVRWSMRHPGFVLVSALALLQLRFLQSREVTY